MVAKAKTRVTFAEYAAMPETNQIVELIDGEIVRETVVNISPYAHHETLSKVKSYLVDALKIELLYNSPGGMTFDDDTHFEPDLFWISPENDVVGELKSSPPNPLSIAWQRGRKSGLSGLKNWFANSIENNYCYLEEGGRYWHGAPDLVIEILSPSTASNDRGTKFDTYEKNGVREYWMVDPDAKFTEVYRHDGSRFERQGVFKPDQPFISAVLGSATIDSQHWYVE